MKLKPHLKIQASLTFKRTSSYGQAEINLLFEQINTQNQLN